MFGSRIVYPSFLLIPPPERFYSKLCSIMICPDIDVSFILFNIIDSKRYCFDHSVVLILLPKVMVFHQRRFSSLLIGLAWIRVVPYLFCLFCINTNDDIKRFEKPINKSIYICELFIPIFMAFCMECFLIAFERKSQIP